MKNISILPLGYIVPDTLKKVSDGIFEVKVLGKGFNGSIWFDIRNDYFHYGKFNDTYLQLNKQQQMAIEQTIFHFINS